MRETMMTWRQFLTFCYGSAVVILDPVRRRFFR